MERPRVAPFLSFKTLELLSQALTHRSFYLKIDPSCSATMNVSYPRPTRFWISRTQLNSCAFILVEAEGVALQVACGSCQMRRASRSERQRSGCRNSWPRRRGESVAQAASRTAMVASGVWKRWSARFTGDGGWEPAAHVCCGSFRRESQVCFGDRGLRGRLQNAVCRNCSKENPCSAGIYKIMRRKVLDHNKTFFVKSVYAEKRSLSDKDPSRKQAEQQAAKFALDISNGE